MNKHVIQIKISIQNHEMLVKILYSIVLLLTTHFGESVHCYLVALHTLHLTVSLCLDIEFLNIL